MRYSTLTQRIARVRGQLLEEQPSVDQRRCHVYGETENGGVEHKRHQ
jgi:hypothetical protein